LVGKKIILSKIKEIKNAGELLEVFDAKRLFESYSGFSAYFRLLAHGNWEFRGELGREKLHLTLRPILHPTRRLLREDRIDGAELLACPHIPEPLALDLRHAGVAHVDLNGRLFLRTPNGLIDIRPGEIRFRSPRKGPDPFSPKAARIVRSLLCLRDGVTTQEELAEQTGTSRALVSQVLGRLAEDDLIRQLSTSGPENPAHYQLADFDRLLSAWERVDRWQSRVTVHEYSVLSNRPEDIARKVIDSVGKESVAFTQWFAAWLRRPHTTPPVISAYVKKRHVLEIIAARRVTSGGNLWLIVPEDEGVWQKGREIGDFPVVSDVQIYLDLLQVGLRGPETAAELRKWEDFAR
jgi:hypothetical protein